MPERRRHRASSGGAISPMVRSTDKTEAQMLLEVITGAVDRRRHHAPRGRLHVRGKLRLRRRPGVLVRAEHRRHRRLAAEARLARRDGRRVGDVRGVAPPAARRHRRRGGDGIGPLVDRRPDADLPDGDGPVLPRPAGRRRRVASPRSRPGRSSTRARSPSARWPRSRPGARRDAPGTTRTRRSAATSTSTRCSPRTTCDAPLRRHDLPPITDGACAVVIARADKARELCEQPGVDHRLRALQRAPLPGHARPHVVAVDHARGQGGRAGGGAGRGGRAPGRVHPRGAAAGRGPRPRRRRGGEPVGRTARRQPDHGDRPGPRRRGRAADPRPRPQPHARALDVGSVPAAEPGLHPREGNRK